MIDFYGFVHTWFLKQIIRRLMINSRASLWFIFRLIGLHHNQISSHNHSNECHSAHFHKYFWVWPIKFIKSFIPTLSMTSICSHNDHNHHIALTSFILILEAQYPRWIIYNINWTWSKIMQLWSIGLVHSYWVLFQKRWTTWIELFGPFMGDKWRHLVHYSTSIYMCVVMKN